MSELETRLDWARELAMGFEMEKALAKVER